MFKEKHRHITENISLRSLDVFLDVGPYMREGRSVDFIVNPAKLHQFSYSWGYWLI